MQPRSEEPLLFSINELMQRARDEILRRTKSGQVTCPGEKLVIEHDVGAFHTPFVHIRRALIKP